MKTADLLSFCRYYKGEDENPYDVIDPRYNAWNCEKCWISLKNTDDNFLHGLCQEFLSVFPDWTSDAPVPVSLRALIFDRYTHFGGSDAGFISFYNSIY